MLPKVTILKIELLSLALLAIGGNALAQQAPVASGQMQQIPTVPKVQTPAPDISIKKQGDLAVPGEDQTKILVKNLKISGASVYPEAELIQVAGFLPGTELSLDQLRQMAARISNFYHRQGYFVAQAYLPAQDIQNGNLTIAVLEGRYGKITVHNQSNVSDSLINGHLAGLHENDVITAPVLENGLLLLSDLPGVRLNSVLAPGSALGDSDLSIDVMQGERFSGSVDADNAGNRYTGVYRYGLTLNFNEPLGQGDLVSLRALTSGQGLRYARGSYQMQFGKLKAGLAYSSLEYKLGKEFEDLGAHGSTKVSSVFVSYPLIRTRNNNLYGQLGFDSKIFKDYVDSVATRSDKRSRLGVASLFGDFRDNVGAGAQNNYSVTLSSGNINLESPVTRSFDAITANRNGHFSKINFNAMRLQNISPSVSVYGAVSGQFASKNLDVSEKMELGGMYAVRAYPEGEAFADQGILANLEFRLRLPNFSPGMSSQLQLIAFIDAGRVDINKNPWSNEPNHRSLSGAGVGIVWSDYNNFLVKAYYAKKLGNGMSTSAPDSSGRFWIQAVKYF